MKTFKNSQGDTIQELGDITTNESFWDCDCDENYIHSKSMASCPMCGINESEAPDSREDEVQKQIYSSLN